MSRAVVFMALLLFSSLTLAHQASTSYLSLQLADNDISGTWSISVRDLELALGINQNQDSNITWGELLNSSNRIQQYAASSLSITVGQSHCTMAINELALDTLHGDSYLALPLSIVCEPTEFDALDINYNLLFSMDTQHRGLLNLVTPSTNHNAIFSPTDKEQRFLVNEVSMMNQWLTFIAHGAWHIWIGFDHILFLITLLLPSVLFIKNNQWTGHNHWRSGLVDTVKIVTAFTIAHSITLLMASLEIVSFPSQWVEISIAISVLVVAVNNLKSFLPVSRSQLAFLFGLVHGLGFASVLKEIMTGQPNLLLNLLGFNIGVELGQLAIIGTWYPAAYVIRNTGFYQLGIMKFGSIAISIIAVFWIYERVLYV